MIYRLVSLLCCLVFRGIFGRRLVGRENVPADGAVIIACNHISNLDPPVVSTGIWRPCAFMAKEELFASRFFGWFITQLNAFPVKRGTADRAALKRSVEILEQDGALVMFPEGTRSESGELQPPEMGVGMIVYRSGAPVVPAYVWGTNQVMPRSGGLHFARIGVRYGKPIRFEAPPNGKPGREEYEAAAQRIMEAIAELRDQEAASRS